MPTPESRNVHWAEFGHLHPALSRTDGGLKRKHPTCSVGLRVTIAGMGSDDWYKPNPTPAPPRMPKPGNRVWTLVKAGRRFDCELRFQGESYGWECQLFEDGELRHGWRFPLHQGAATEAEIQRQRFLREGWTAPVTSHPAD